MADVNTPAEAPSVEGAADPTSDSPRLKAVTHQLAEEVRPLVDVLSAVPDAARPLLERARPVADVFAAETSPLLNDLRRAVQELRVLLAELRVLLAELLSYASTAAAQLAAWLAERLDPRVVNVATQVAALLGRLPVARLVGIAGAGARRLASVRPTLRALGPVPAMGRALPAPHVAVPRLPSLAIGAAMRSIARRLRPGRWAFRATAIGIIALAVGNPSLRDAMVEEISWTRSAIETIQLPTVELPTIELPTLELPNIELPTIELPTIELPTIEIPAFEMPTIQFPTAQSAAAPKLVPAGFELPPLDAYRATFETQASYPTVAPNASVEWVVALRNTGSVGWYRGVAGAQAALALTDGTEVAVQTTPYVAPGQVGWFIVRFRAPAGPGAHAVALFPRIDGRGELPNLGIYTLVTVR
jgi:hypothetical protein